MMRSKATAKHRIAALGMAAALILSIAPVNALADDEIGEYKVGDTFTSESADAELPENIPENTKWVGPEAKYTYAEEPSCEMDEGEVKWSEEWTEISEADYKALDTTLYTDDQHKKVELCEIHFLQILERI